MLLREIPIASDHGGFEMKQFLVEKLKEAGYNVVDYGTNSLDSVDYPDYIHPLASDINRGKYNLGIIICGSGNGAQMTANKYPNVRAALCWSEELTKLARQHNNANIISLPGRFISNELAWEMIKIFLNTEFEGGRHEKRVEKIKDCEIWYKTSEVEPPDGTWLWVIRKRGKITKGTAVRRDSWNSSTKTWTYIRGDNKHIYWAYPVYPTK